MKLIVKSQSVTFRRKIYAPGDEVDLPDKIAKNLVGTGVCETPGKKGKEKTEKRIEKRQTSNIERPTSNIE